MSKLKIYKTPSESEIIKTEVVCPNDTNPMGILQGGRLVEWMDIAAAICAQTHTEKICVTASIMNVNFKLAAKIGDIVTVKAKMTRSFQTSMEIVVQSFARNVHETKNKLISEAYFTFVALSENEKISSDLTPIKPTTILEKQLFRSALKRKHSRMKTMES